MAQLPSEDEVGGAEGSFAAKPGVIQSGAVQSGTAQGGAAQTGIAPSDMPQPGTPIRRHTRRLEDKLLVAFHHACDVADIEVARHMLQILELMLSRKASQPDPNRRRNMEGLVAAHERLWNLRNREN